jgi:hypothetical protein
VFSSPPTGPVIASWTNIVTPEPVFSNLNRPQGVDFLGDGTPQSGPISAMSNKTPGGVSGHIDAGCSSELNYLLGEIGTSFPGYQFGAPGYTQMASWLYDTRFPSTIPGSSASTPFISTGQWRTEGAFSFIFATDPAQGICDQWGIDVVTKSTFSGTIASGVLTLSANAVGPMWEGEVIGCAPFSLTCGVPQGVYITGLASGAWGAASSTYKLAGAGSASFTGAMQNAVYYTGPGPAIYAGPANDITVQPFTFASSAGDSVHMGPGPAGGRRVGARLAASIWRVPSRVVLEFADASSGGMRLSDHAARSMI